MKESSALKIEATSDFSYVVHAADSEDHLRKTLRSPSLNYAQVAMGLGRSRRNALCILLERPRNGDSVLAGLRFTRAELEEMCLFEGDTAQ
jgi:hypothetical protein